MMASQEEEGRFQAVVRALGGRANCETEDIIDVQGTQQLVGAAVQNRRMLTKS